jgi:hypothetical protein
VCSAWAMGSIYVLVIFEIKYCVLVTLNTCTIITTSKMFIHCRGILISLINNLVLSLYLMFPSLDLYVITTNTI